MTCTTCSATIADKAIVCYRCGAPTAVPAPPAPRPAAKRSPAVGATLLAVAAALGGAAVGLPADGGAEIAAAVGSGVSALAGLYALIRR